MFNRLKGFKWFKWLTASLIFLSGLSAGWLLNNIIDDYNAGTRSEKEELHEGQYALINPLLECENSENLISKGLSGFKQQIANLVNERIEGKKADSVSVYFRDLNNGPWFGIGEKDEFIPGSLLKIPLMMAYFKQAEFDPHILTKKIKFEGSNFITHQYIQPSMTIAPGKSYTVQELIYMMIVNSDNYAAWLLNINDTLKIKDKVYADLGLAAPGTDKPYSINVKRYGSFFRVLFNASYLRKETSNASLDLLARVEFRRGLPAGVPQDVVVAHKFGEREVEGQKQFHDCGIVYYPQHPYLLCVMSRGNNYEDLISTIQDISSIVYTEVDRQLKNQ